jgi:hypothetical protein
MMLMRFALPALLMCLMGALGCEPESTDTHDGASTTVITPAPGGDHTDVHVRPSGDVDVDVSPQAAPANNPVNVDVSPGGGVNVDVNPEAVGERIRERREERREAAETP